MPEVTLSVCIPVYNCRDYITKAVDSVLVQSFADFELIIVDNCSTDGTYELLSDYDDPRIRLLRNDTNIGACGNWNRALREASGRYIKVLCADDVIYPDCLERQLAILEQEDAAVVMVSSGRDIIDERGRNVFRRQYPGSSGRVRGHDVIRKAVLRGTNVVGDVASVLFKREAAVRAGEFDGSLPYVIDIDYWVRVLKNGDLHVMNDYLSAYRVIGDSWSVALAQSQTANFSALIDRINRDYGVPLSRLDMAAGKMMARFNSLLRKVFYHVYLQR